MCESYVVGGGWKGMDGYFASSSTKFHESSWKVKRESSNWGRIRWDEVISVGKVNMIDNIFFSFFF